MIESVLRMLDFFPGNSCQLPILFFKRLSKRYLDLMLGFAAGVMIGFAVMMLLDVLLG